MSNIERFENIRQVVRMVEPEFNQLARIHGAVHFKREASFALQALANNSYLAQTALADQDSLKHAIINVAAIGLTLSPVYKLAYLVPRDGRVCLDISYRGYIQLGVDVGAIKWATAEIVHAKDKFELKGLGKEPTHERSPFGDRGPMVGAYCAAKTHDGDYLVTVMTIEEVYAIRGRSSSWRAYEKDKKKTNPWVTDETEMIKKTVIRRAYKSWPMTDTSKRLDEAVDITDKIDPIDINLPAEESAPDVRGAGIARIRDMLKELGRTEDKYIEHLVRANRREIKRLEELTDQEITQAITMLQSFVDAKNARVAKEAETNENAG